MVGLPEGVFTLPLKSLDIGCCTKLPIEVIGTICQKMHQLELLGLAGLEMTSKLLVISCSTTLQSDVILTGLPKMDGCSALTDLDLSCSKKLSADGLAEFCANPPPALRKLDLANTSLESKHRGSFMHRTRNSIPYCFRISGHQEMFGYRQVGRLVHQN